MRLVKRAAQYLGILGGMAAIFFALGWFLMRSVQHSQPVHPTSRRLVRLVAVGDSLTQGVGDPQTAGGFVPLVARSLSHSTSVRLSTVNAGEAGDITSRVMDRINGNPQLQRHLRQADIITVTAGGNDALSAISAARKDLSRTDAKHLIAPAAATYTEHLRALLERIRQLNRTAPVFVLGIYNPFYVELATNSVLNTGVTTWNYTIRRVTRQQPNMYYVNISRIGYGQYGQTQPSRQLRQFAAANTPLLSSASVSQLLVTAQGKNAWLSSTDRLHPNERGYRYIAQQVTHRINQEQRRWLHHGTKTTTRP
ncbi:GDSL-type esterase/lipase family protein [Ligilactobacillus sp. LYQ60]|uniref:GDSL-type esterase/lipase family protein n=1 Tax=unclassified Ligilactobacillus TaxID=2767920 RepID=UPI0038552133